MYKPEIVLSCLSECENTELHKSFLLDVALEKPSTVVVVLNFNGLNDTMACLESLVTQDEPHIEILVVDNGSAEDPTAKLRSKFPNMPILRLPENQGWAGGNNMGITWARTRGAEVICLLNNDTVIPAGAIARLAATAHALKPCLLHPAIDYAEPGAGPQLDPTLCATSPRLAGHEDIHVLDHAYGACLVIPVQVFDRIGLFDERFFLQLEETDFYARAQQHGIAALCLPEVRIIHAESRSFGARLSPLKTYYISRNSLLFSSKHHRHLAARLRAARKLYWTLTGIATHERGTPLSAKKMLFWALSAKPHAQALRQGVYDYLRGRFGKACFTVAQRPALSLISEPAGSPRLTMLHR